VTSSLRIPVASRVVAVILGLLAVLLMPGMYMSQELS
jgi:hypothetical protein